MPVTDAHVQQALESVAGQIDAARAAKVEGPLARIIERLETLKHQPAAQESGEELLRIVDELQQHIQASIKAAAPAEAAAGRNELSYDQQQTLQQGIRAQIATVAEGVRQTRRPKKSGVSARRGRRAMI